MSSPLFRALGVAALLVVLAACTPPGVRNVPSPAERAAARGVCEPLPAGDPGPPATDVRLLLSTDEVSRATGFPAWANGGYGIAGLREFPQAHGIRCEYRSGNTNIFLTVGIVPASAYTPQQVVDRSIGTYDGVPEQLADLGDAAQFRRRPDRDAGLLVVAKSAGPETRFLELSAKGNGEMLVGGGDGPGPVLFQLGRLALDRI